MDFTVPVGVTATVHIPANDPNAITENGKSIKESPELEFLAMERASAN